jgi:hypothetical protein
MARQSILDIFYKYFISFIKSHASLRNFSIIEKILGKKTVIIKKLDNLFTTVNEHITKKKRSLPKKSGEKQIRKDAVDLTSDKTTDTMPDVLLDVPALTADEIKMNLDDLNGQVALHAELADIVKINVGVTVGIKKIDLDIKKLNVQAVLKVRLKQVYAIFHRTLDALEQRPDILKKQTQMSGGNKDLDLDKTFKSSINQVPGTDTDPHFRSGKKHGIINSQITFGNRNSSDFRNSAEYLNQSIYAKKSIKKGEVRSHFRSDK